MKQFERVVVVGKGSTIPIGTVGRVVKQDFARSQSGYDTLVVWKLKCGKKRMRTWIPARLLGGIHGRG